MNSETLEILFYFLTISMPATFFVSKSFHNLTSSYFFLARSDTLNLVYYVHTICDTWPAAPQANFCQPLYNNHITSAGYGNGQVLH